MRGLILKRVLVLFLIILFCATLIGCYDMKELDNRAFVLAYGIENSKINNLKFTVMIASPKKLIGGGQQGGGGGDEAQGLVVTTIDAPTLPVAINLINTYVGRTLYFGHAGFAFYSEDFMRKGDETILQSPQKLREIRRDTKVFVVKGGVAEFIKEIKPKIAANPIKYLRQITDSQNNTGLTPSTDMYKFFEDVESFKIDAVLPLCSQSNKKSSNKMIQKNKNLWDIQYKAGDIPKEGGLLIEFLGSAIFKGNKMVDTLNGMETRILNLIRGNFQSAIFAFPDINDPKYLQSVLIKKGKNPRVKVDLSGKEPKIDANISLDGDLMSTQGYTDYSKKENVSILEEKIENILSTESNNLVKKMQKQNTDIFGFGYYVAKDFLTWDDYKKYNWLTEKYKQAKIDVRFNYQIRRIGFQGGQIKPGD